MKKYLFITLCLLPITASAAGNTSRFIKQDYSRLERHFEYECIAEHRDKTPEDTRACIKEKKGKSTITINKFWEEDPAKRTVKVQ